MLVLSSKIKRILLIVVFAVTTILIGSVVFDKCNDKPHQQIENKIDSLNKVNDSLKQQIDKKTASIDSIKQADYELIEKIRKQYPKIIKVKQYIALKKDSVNKLNDSGFVRFFETRYPKDTISKPLVLARPVLQSAANDLIEYDGLKEHVTNLDSIIEWQDKRIALKDSVIKKQDSKFGDLMKISSNKDLQMDGMRLMIDDLKKDNKKLNRQVKTYKTIGYVLLGGVATAIIIK